MMRVNYVLRSDSV